jgi:hypothetical protein
MLVSQAAPLSVRWLLIKAVHRNAGIVPIVYLFYPETAYRSLEEMDNIFRKTTSIFSVVRVAKEEPCRYGRKGELLVNYSTTVEPVDCYVRSNRQSDEEMGIDLYKQSKTA